MDPQELTAIEGLLGLSTYFLQNSSRASLHSQDSNRSSSVHLSPISPINDTNERLPSIAQVLSSPNATYTSSPVMASPTCSLSFIMSMPMCPSMSSSCSSYASSIASSSSEHVPQQATKRTLRRTTACILNTGRRGRPKKSSNSNKKDNEFKIINCEYEKIAASSTSSKAANNNVVNCTVKPRWQDSERISLIEAIVQEKELDDMTTIPWDKVSKAVGRAKKACKDQWRREILPHILKGFVRPDQRICSNDNNDAK